MSELFVGVSYIFRHEISPSYQEECAPPLKVLRLSATADRSLIKKLENKAISLTNENPIVRNDFSDRGLSRTPVFRVAHALEHIVVMDWLREGILKESELKLGSIAATLAGNRRGGQDIADVWLNDYLGSQIVFASEILRQVELFGGRWQYE